MSLIRPLIASISFLLFMAFAGQMLVHAAEKAGWFCCESSMECHQDNETPVTPHSPVGGCSHAGCSHQMVVLFGNADLVSPAASSSIHYPPFSNLRPDGPVFEIEIPPQQS